MSDSLELLPNFLFDMLFPARCMTSLSLVRCNAHVYSWRWQGSHNRQKFSSINQQVFLVLHIGVRVKGCLQEKKLFKDSWTTKHLFKAGNMECKAQLAGDSTMLESVLSTWLLFFTFSRHLCWFLLFPSIWFSLNLCSWSCLSLLLNLTTKQNKTKHSKNSDREGPQ